MIRTLIFSFLFSFSFCYSSFAIDASVTHAVFQSEQGKYVEIYTRIFSGSILGADSPGAATDLEMLVVLKHNNEIKIAEKYGLQSDYQSMQDLWDRKRFQIESGTIEIEITISNLSNSTDSSYRHKLSFQNTLNVGEVAFSEPLLLSDIDQDSESQLAFRKHNFNFEPLAYNLVTADQEKLMFFLELYQIDTSFTDSYYISYTVFSGAEEELGVQELQGFKKVNKAGFYPLILQMDLAKLRSGNYTMVVEARDRNKNLLHSTKKVFSKYDPVNDVNLSANYNNTDYTNSFVQLLEEEELDYALKAITPQVGNAMSEILNQIIASDDLKVKRYYLFSHWSKVAPENPQLIYEKYMEVAKAVDKTYRSQLGFGFETDRGYIFMKYGKPHDIVSVEDEPSAPPYEIWIYEYVELTKQSKVKFLFYNPSLGHNDFELLHSTCRGERKNVRWEFDLYKDAVSETNPNTIDNRNMEQNWNRNARRYFEDY